MESEMSGCWHTIAHELPHSIVHQREPALTQQSSHQSHYFAFIAHIATTTSLSFFLSE